MRQKFVVSALVLVALALLGCQRSEYREVKQYTIEQFYNTTSIFGSSFSPDEKTILFSSNKSGIYNAYTMPVAGGEPTQLTDSTGNAVFALSFFPHDNRILYRSDQAGNEIWHLYVRDEDGTVQELTPGEKARAVFYGWSHDEKSFFYGSNQRDTRFMDVYEMGIEGFTSTMIYRNDAGYSLGDISNDKRYMAFVKAITTNNSEMYLYDRETKELKHLSPHEGDVNYNPATFSVDSQSLYYLTDEGSEFTYLMSYDITSSEKEKVEEAEWDIFAASISRKGKYRVVAINKDARTEIRVYDTTANQHVNLPRLPEGQISGLNISQSEKLMTFYLNGSTSPNNLFVYDFEAGQHRKLTDTMNPEIEPADLVDAEVIRYPSFDGVEIPAIYYRPHHVRKDGTAPALIGNPAP